MEQPLDSFRSSTWGWLRGTLAGWGTMALVPAGLLLTAVAPAEIGRWPLALAVLAVLIRSPSRYDPEVSPEEATDRWGRVLDAMVEEGWLTSDERTASVYPPVLPKTGSSLGLPKITSTRPSSFSFEILPTWPACIKSSFASFSSKEYLIKSVPTVII